jgi:hypothetical protein
MINKGERKRMGALMPPPPGAKQRDENAYW